MMRSKPIDGELRKLQIEIEGYAVEYGLDFFPQLFEICDYDTINILAAQGGFPNRYPHWKFGMDYDQLSKGYAYGLQKIYEMVINTDPCYAYLLRANNWVDQKIVMAHVYGHNDFFKNNSWFRNTNRKMMDVMANHGTKIRRYMSLYGQNTVEKFIDRVLSLENLLDVNHLFETTDTIRRRKMLNDMAEVESEKDFHEGASEALRSFLRTKEREERLKDTPEVQSNDDEFEISDKVPKSPTRDILKFLIEYAPIEEWQADVIGILREEAYYFLPQRMTKIMNEGWASYWHSKIMTERALDASEIIDFADKHAGVMAMSKQNINPYKIGIELMRDIEYRWDKGMFGKDYNECPSLVDKENWDTKLMKGKEKIFEVRRSHNDITFIDEFLTPEFCNRMQLFTYKYNPRSGRYEIDSRDFEAIKYKLLNQLTNFGSPLIHIIDANFANRNELLMEHTHYGVDLDMQYASETMRNIYAIWKRPVNLKTIFDEKEVIFHFNGKEIKPIHS